MKDFLTKSASILGNSFMVVGAVALVLFVCGVVTQALVNAQQDNIMPPPAVPRSVPIQPVSQQVADLERENAQLQAKMKAMVPAPLPQGRRDMLYAAQMAPLNCTLLDDHLYGVHVPDGMRITSQDLNGLTMQGLADLVRTNRSATVLWLSAK